jgi:hypothetical protein
MSEQCPKCGEVELAVAKKYVTVGDCRDYDRVVVDEEEVLCGVCGHVGQPQDFGITSTKGLTEVNWSSIHPETAPPDPCDI